MPTQREAQLGALQPPDEGQQRMMEALRYFQEQPFGMPESTLPGTSQEAQVEAAFRTLEFLDPLALGARKGAEALGAGEEGQLLAEQIGGLLSPGPGEFLSPLKAAKRSALLFGLPETRQNLAKSLQLMRKAFPPGSPGRQSLLRRLRKGLVVAETPSVATVGEGMRTVGSFSKEAVPAGGNLGMVPPSSALRAAEGGTADDIVRYQNLMRREAEEALQRGRLPIEEPTQVGRIAVTGEEPVSTGVHELGHAMSSELPGEFAHAREASGALLPHPRATYGNIPEESFAFALEDAIRRGESLKPVDLPTGREFSVAPRGVAEMLAVPGGPESVEIYKRDREIKRLLHQIEKLRKP